MSLYAEGTGVSESKTKVQIDQILRKWKATNIAVGEQPGVAIVYFSIAKWHVRFSVPMPTVTEAAKRKNHHGYLLGTASQGKWLDGERRRRWRALLLTIKAKLVSVENAVESFEQAFLAHLMIDGGSTVGQRVLPMIEEIYKSGKASGPLLGPGEIT